MDEKRQASIDQISGDAKGCTISGMEYVEDPEGDYWVMKLTTPSGNEIELCMRLMSEIVLGLYRRREHYPPPRSKIDEKVMRFLQEVTEIASMEDGAVVLTYEAKGGALGIRAKTRSDDKTKWMIEQAARLIKMAPGEYNTGPGDTAVPKKPTPQ